MTWWEILIVAWATSFLFCCVVVRLWVHRQRQALRRIRADVEVRRLDRQFDEWDWPRRSGGWPGA